MDFPILQLLRKFSGWIYMAGAFFPIQTKGICFVLYLKIIKKWNALSIGLPA